MTEPAMNTIAQNVSLKNKTSFRIGGTARFYAKAHAEEDICPLLQRARNENLPVFLLGRGTNLLVSDTGWPGLVIDTTGLTAIRWEGSAAACQSGALLHTLVREAVDRGYGGIEQLAGIPGTVGGGLIMNAGAYQQTISDCLVSVRGIDSPSCTIWERWKGDLDFKYRYSSLQEKNAVVLGARFGFYAGDKNALSAVFHEKIVTRSGKHPLDKPNCGSVFKNPEGNHAASLIEKCGLKGFRVNGAQVSEKHANFIVNISKATASDVRTLIARVQEKVFHECGVLLEPEVIFVGEFDTPLFRPHTPA